jgi:translation initiation factor 2B subunit (eIF-2B alpha/beta/delta family)
MFDQQAFIQALPEGSRQALEVFSDPHPPGAVERARLSGRALVEFARAWPAGQPGLPAAIAEVVAGIRQLGQTTLHHPQVENYMAAVIGPGVPDDGVLAAQELGERAAAAERRTQDAIDTCAELGADLLAAGDSVIVTDFSPSSSWAILERASRDGKLLTVYVPACRTRRASGFRAAEEARTLGHKSIIVTDAGTGWVLTSRPIRAAFIGADAFLPDGTILTTNGALAIASIGAHLDISVYSVFDLWKYLPRWLPQIDELNDLEDPDGVPEACEIWAPGGFEYLNPLVDRIPGSLFKAAITDAGVIDPASVGAAALARYGDVIVQGPCSVEGSAPNTRPPHPG